MFSWIFPNALAFESVQIVQKAVDMFGQRSCRLRIVLLVNSLFAGHIPPHVRFIQPLHISRVRFSKDLVKQYVVHLRRNLTRVLVEEHPGMIVPHVLQLLT